MLNSKKNLSVTATFAFCLLAFIFSVIFIVVFCVTLHSPLRTVKHFRPATLQCLKEKVLLNLIINAVFTFLSKTKAPAFSVVYEPIDGDGEAKRGGREP